MTGLLDNHQIEMACPQCGRKFKERLGRLKNNPKIRCPGCCTNISVSTSSPGGLAKGLNTVDKSLAELQRSLKKLGK